MPRVVRPCRDCHGLGFVLSSTSGSLHCPDGTLKVQKCDGCGVFPYDDEAEEVAARVLAVFLDPKCAGIRMRPIDVALPLSQKFAPSILRRWRAHSRQRYVVDVVRQADVGTIGVIRGEVVDLATKTRQFCCLNYHITKVAALRCARRRRKLIIGGRG